MKAWLLWLAVVTLSVLGCHRGRPTASPSLGSARAPSFEAERVEVELEASPPSGVPAKPALSLTASDGTGLRLASLEARAVVYGPLAFTELHLTFDNDEPRTREGTFSIQLPEGAAVSRFAMEIGGEWQEAEVVEREAARVAYETVIHRKVDPAIMVREAGNVFSTKVFPIFARQQKRIIVSYSHELARVDEPYRLSLRGLPALGTLDVQVLVPSQRRVFVAHRTEAVPEGDFLWAPPKATSDAVRGGRWALVRTEPRPSTTLDPLDTVAVVVDSSASRAGAYPRDLERIARVLDKLGAKTTLAAFDQQVEPLTMPAAVTRRPAGASNLRAALDWVATAKARRAILVTDGIPSAGPTSAAELLRSVRGIERLDTIAVGARRDSTLLRALAEAGTLARRGALIDGDGATDETIERELTHAASLRGNLAIAGAKRTWSEASFVYAEIDERAKLEATAGGAPRTIVTEEAPPALVERAVVQARIRELSERGDADARREIVKLSVEHRVLSDHTAMLVLETDADYERFRIRRDTLADILVVDAHGVVAGKRNDVVVRRSNSRISPLDPRRASAPDPSLDRDHDGIPDLDDKCPDDPEAYNGFEDADGCPDKGRVIIEANNILILQKVVFAVGSNEVAPDSVEIIEALATTMIHHPELTLVEIAGHTDERGDASTNMRTSQLRAEAVMKALVERKVPKARLRASGYGEYCPEDPAHDEEAWARNRRVEFKIIATNNGPTGVELGCENAFARGVPRPPGAPRASFRGERWKGTPYGDPLSGTAAEVDRLLRAKRNDEALAAAETWLARDPGDRLAWIAEGRALDALGRPEAAARAYGSLLDLALTPEHRRAAGNFLESLAGRWPKALDLAIDAYRRAAAERPDHASSHRLLAWALAHAGRTDEAVDVLLGALGRPYDERRLPGVGDVLRRDVGILAAASRRAGGNSTALEEKLGRVSARFAASAALVAALTWETDESDLDLLVEDGTDRFLETNDVTLGYGPEAPILPVTPGTPARKLQVQMVRRGPQGFALGKVAIVAHDGAGHLRFDDRPFVLMNDGAAVPLGIVP